MCLGINTVPQFVSRFIVLLSIHWIIHGHMFTDFKTGVACVQLKRIIPFVRNEESVDVRWPCPLS